MGECTSKEWGRGKKKIVKKKLTRAEVEALIPGRHGMTASEAAGATDVIMAAMEDVSTSWEVHDDGDDDKDDHHQEQSMATKAEQVKQQDTVAISTRTEVHQHNLEEVVENAPLSSIVNAQLDKEKHDHPMTCTAASSSQHSESLIESFEYVQHSDAGISNKEIEIKQTTLLSEYLAVQQTFEKLSTNAPQDPEHRDKDIIAMAHSTGLLESVNKRIQDLLQLQLQSDTQIFKEQDMSESERNQMKDSLNIGVSTQQMSESYIANLQKALQLIRLKEATETGHEIGPEDLFAPEKVNSSECCGTSKISATQETAGADTISNLKQKLLTEANSASLENSTVARNSELQEKLVNVSILHQEQIKEAESMSNPGESNRHAVAKAENSLSIEEKDISPITAEDIINKEITPITSPKTKDGKVNQKMEYTQHLEHSRGTVQPEIPDVYETSPGHKIREVQGQEHTQTMTDGGVVQHANVQAEPLVSYRTDIILGKDLIQDGAESHLDLNCQKQQDADTSNRVAEDIINPSTLSV